MRFFDRLKNGWQLAKMSLATINENRTLLLFPVFSTISLILVLITFFGGGYFLVGDQISTLLDSESSGSNVAAYAIVFVYYLINFFIMVFFNAALVHCAMKIFKNEETSVGDGFNFALSRIGQIFSWAVVAATVGTILQVIRDNGKIGEFAASLIGGAWSILTFFVVPVIIYEDKSFYEAIKSSTNLVKEKWGESLAANMSFGFFHFIGILLSVATGFFLASIAHPVVGVAVGLSMIIMISIVVSAARTVFVAAVYNRVKGLPTGHFEGGALDDVFIQK